MKRSLDWYRKVMREEGHEDGSGFCIVYGGNRERCGIRILEDPLFAISIDKKMQDIVRSVLSSPKGKNYASEIREETGLSNSDISVRLDYLYRAGVFDYHVVPTQHHSPSVGVMDIEWFSVSRGYKRKLKALLMRKQKS
jgi:transcription initiation factor IIE alpha subunit